MIARLFYAAALILFILGLLTLVHVFWTGHTWIGLWVGAFICAVLGAIFDRRGRVTPLV